MNLAWLSSLEPERISAFATPALTLISALIIAIQIRLQARDNKRNNAVSIFMSCLNEFDVLMRERLEILLSDEPSEKKRARVRFFYNRYWDLMLTEFEFAKQDLLPRSLFIHFCVRLRHAFQGRAEESFLEDMTATQGWLEVGQPAITHMAPPFCAMIEGIRAAETDEQVRKIVRARLKKNRKWDFFGSVR